MPLPRGRIYAAHKEAKQTLAGRLLAKEGPAWGLQKEQEQVFKNLFSFPDIWNRRLGTTCPWVILVGYAWAPLCERFCDFKGLQDNSTRLLYKHKNWHILGWGEKNKLMPKSKAAGLEGFVIAVQRLLKEAFTCPRPSVLPASSPCGILPMAFGEPSGLLLPPASCQDNALPPCPSAHRPGYYKSRFACQATHTCCHQK